jgi:hypothetical protein
VKLRRPLWIVSLSDGVNGQVEAGVQVSGEAGEGVALLPDTGLDQVSGR